MRFDRAFSSFDSYALERRLGSGLLLRHPQVSNTIRKQWIQSKMRSSSFPRKIRVTNCPIRLHHPNPRISPIQRPSQQPGFSQHHPNIHNSKCLFLVVDSADDALITQTAPTPLEAIKAHQGSRPDKGDS